MKRRFKLECDFSDNIDRICPKCENLQSECICNKPPKILDNATHKLKMRLEVRNGRKISIIYPFYLANPKEILQTLKKNLACGGTLEHIEDYSEIHLQGELRDRAKQELQNLGFGFAK